MGRRRRARCLAPRVPAQEIVGWAAEGILITHDNGQRKAGAHVEWAADVDDVATTVNQWPETLRSGLSHRQSLKAVHEVAVDVIGLAIRHEINIAREQVLEHDLDLETGK